MSSVKEMPLEEITKDFGAEKFPPYPQSFEIPLYIMEKWRYVHKGGNMKNKDIPLLQNNALVKLSRGDRFNAIVMPRRINSGEKGPHRIFQFRYDKYGNDTGWIGYVCDDRPVSGAPILEKGQAVRKGIVLRFEVTDVSRSWFMCVPLAYTFDKNNIEDNLVNCNYEKRRR